MDKTIYEKGKLFCILVTRVQITFRLKQFFFQIFVERHTETTKLFSVSPCRKNTCLVTWNFVKNGMYVAFIPIYDAVKRYRKLVLF